MQADELRTASSLADMAVLTRVMEEHGPKLLAMLRRRLAPSLSVRLEPEDLLNETFLQARRRWPQRLAHPELTDYAWLYRIAMDCLIEAWRRETRDRRDLRRDLPWPEASSVQLVLGLVGGGTSPSEAAARADLQQRMQKTLEMLKEIDREILWMRHYDGLTFPEAAAVLGIQESAATLRYVRALKRLKQLWQRLYPQEESTS